jgi:crotonobetainyl-CoA:carnitine CoA-transferase CaiB-like acyl-CoA transferase
VAIQAALAQRERTGAGQLIEVAQLETGACLTAEQIIDWSLGARTRPREGNRHRLFAPQGVYRCRDDDGSSRWVAISARDDSQWLALAGEIGAVDLRELPVAERRARHDELDERIGSWTATHLAAEVVARLRPHRIPVAAVLTVGAMYDEPQLNARAYYQSLDNPKTGTRRYPGWPMRFTVGPRPREVRLAHHRFGPPTLGGDNDTVLWRELGVGAAELAELRASGIIGDRMKAGE